MKIIFICLFTIFSIALFAQTPTVLSDSTQAPVKLDCLGDKPLYVVNDKILPCDSVQFINPDNITELQVLRGPSASALYGPAGSKNGTVIIITKEYVNLQEQRKNKSTETKKP